jgi:glucose/arabinose dehydrogenase
MKLVTLVLLVIVLAIGACSLLLPERFAVNAPVAHMLFGLGGDGPLESDFRSEAADEPRIRAAQGFSISIFATDLPNARFLRPTPSGALLVSQPRTGTITMLEPDRDGDGRSDGRRTLLEGLNRPHGMELHDGWLYVGEGDGIGRVQVDDFSASATQLTARYERIVDDLPSGGNHWSRTVRVGPDGWLYVSVGSSCNVCEDAPRRAAMLRFRLDGSGEELYADGLRNSVGFDWRPGSGVLFATDNGRDLLGDDFPPCELNRIEQGGFYGWPYVNGDGVADPDFGDAAPDRSLDAISPAHGFRAHNAPLGMTFIRSDSAPAAYRGAALVALHGSWNRSKKDGYKVVSLHWDEAGRIEERDFAVGFERDDEVVGRPVDVAEGADGAIYISDDYAGAVYRVVAGETQAAPPSRVAHSEPREVAEPAAADATGSASRERGAELYERFECASCHEAARAEIGVVVVELIDLPARYSSEDLAAFLATPTPPMPVFPMNPTERLDLAAYLLGRP